VDLKNVMRVARRRWKSIATMFVLALVISASISITATPQYTSTAKVYVSADTSDAQQAASATFFITSRVKSYADLANHRDLMARVIDQLNLDLTPEQLSEKIEAQNEPETAIILVTVTDPKPQIAQEIARATSELLTGYLEELETPKGSQRSQIKPTITDPATFSNEPVTPRTELNLVIAVLIGLLVGGALAMARELLDNTVNTLENIEEAAGAPVLASVVVDQSMDKHPLLTDLAGFSPRGEAFRMLRTNLQFLNLDDQAKSLVITSAVEGEGKTTTATNLAVALAQTGRRVLLVDGDLRRPRTAGLLGLETKVGLTTVLVGRTKLDESIQRHAASGVYVLASGPTPPNPSEVLQSNATRELLAKLRDLFDVVVIDAPPLLPVADAAILAASADGAILVTRHGKTHRDQLRAAAERLRKVDGRILGVVANMIPRRSAESYHYYYYYDEKETKATKSSKDDGAQPAAARKDRRK